MHAFRSFEDARCHGFVPAVASRAYGHYRGCTIAGFDMSNMRRLGLVYCLRAIIPEEFTSNYMGVTSDAYFGVSEPVRIIARENASRNQSALDDLEPKVIQMFSEQVLAGARDGSRQWINQWFAYHPKAVEQALLHQKQGRAQIAST